MFSVLPRVAGLAGLLTLVACSSEADCLRFGDDLLGDVDRVAEFARTVNVALSEAEASFMVGAAKAHSQIERADVRVCLRPSANGKAEFSVVADNGAVMGWRNAETLCSTVR